MHRAVNNLPILSLSVFFCFCLVDSRHLKRYTVSFNIFSLVPSFRCAAFYSTAFLHSYRFSTSTEDELSLETEPKIRESESSWETATFFDSLRLILFTIKRDSRSDSTSFRLCNIQKKKFLLCYIKIRRKHWTYYKLLNYTHVSI